MIGLLLYVLIKLRQYDDPSHWKFDTPLVEAPEGVFCIIPQAIEVVPLKAALSLPVQTHDLAVEIVLISTLELFM